MDRFFRTIWDKKVLWITVGFTAILVISGAIPLVAFMIASAQGASPTGKVIVILASLLSAVLLLAIMSLAPRGYRLTTDALRIVRLASDIRIPYSEIASAELADGREVFKGAVRVGASGGAFGIFGRFFGGRELPDFQAYVTNTGCLVLIRRVKDSPVVLSPDDPAEFLRILGEQGVAVGS